MHDRAHELIGKPVQKVEQTKRGIVASVADARSVFRIDGTIITFTDGHKGLYGDRDVESMLVDGTHRQNTED